MGTRTAAVAVFALFLWGVQSQNPAWRVRLVGGRNSSEGRVEVTTDGTWGTVCDNQFDNSDARVICRMMGFTSSYNHYAMTDAYFGEGTGPVLLTRLGCTGSEANLTLCSQEQVTVSSCPHSRDAGVICNYNWEAEDVQVRLVGPSPNSSEGRVEVFHRGRWGTVCSRGWDYRDASVVCRQLGLYHGPGIRLKWNGEHGSESKTQRIQLDYVGCDGSEMSIGHCKHSYPWGYTTICNGGSAGVSCQEDDLWQARLVGGEDNTTGRVEVTINGTWGTVCDANFDNNDARVICRMLGFQSGSAYEVSRGYYGAGSGPVLLTRLGCRGNEENLHNCPSSSPSTEECPHSRDVGIVCNYRWSKNETTVRLANSSSSEGLVEVFHNGHWGLICSHGWDENDARVVCRQLGLPSGVNVEARSYRYTGEDFSSEKIHLAYVSCGGTEENIGHCSRSYPWGVSHCSQGSYFAGVACIAGDNPPWEVRLVGGPNVKEGRLEVSSNGTWGTVCDSGFDNNDARVVCRMLGYGSYDHYAIPRSFYGNGTGPMLLTGLDCDGSEANLTLCQQKSPSTLKCSSSFTAGVICSYEWRSQNISVRLVDTTSTERTVEAFIYGQWGKVCDSSWNHADARVVCRQLGLPHGSKVEGRTAYYRAANASDRIYHSRPSCSGAEANIGNCTTSYPWAMTTSSCSYTAQAICNEGENPPWHVRLVGGPDSREGRLEVSADGTWGTVCDEEFDSSDARVVCKMLGYTSNSAYAMSAGYYGAGTGEVKVTRLRCDYSSDNLTYCPQETPANDSCPHSQDVGVVCDYAWQSVDVQVRLANGTAKEGRVEIFRNGRWGTVCGNRWDVNDARVVCRQLGLPHGDKVEAFHYAVLGFGPGSESQVIQLSRVQCVGSEYNIGHCRHSYPWGVHSCSHASDAGVACKGEHPKWRVRLRGGRNNLKEGRVEVTTTSTWGTVCDENFGNSDAQVICRMLGHSNGSHYAVTGAYFGAGTGPVMLTRLGCTGNEAELSLCNQNTPSGVECPHSRDAGVVCDYSWVSEDVDVRLAGGGSDTEGRVEVFHHGQWGTVCSTDWDIQDARVVCRQLGLPSGSGVRVRGHGLYTAPDDSLKIHLSDVQCDGSESNIGRCRRRYPWGVHFCRSAQDAAVACLEGEKEEECTKETCKRGLYPYGYDREDQTLAQQDDVSSQSIYINVGFPVGPNRHARIYVGSNGVISFDAPFNPNFPKVDSYQRARLVAPFWSDINLVGKADSAVFHHVYQQSDNNEEAEEEILQRASRDVQRLQYRPGFNATWVLVATWHSVAPFAKVHSWWHKDYGSVNFATDERVTFQCVLVSDGEESFALFLYKENSFSWRPLQGRRVIIGSVGVDDTFQSIFHSLKDTAYKMDKFKGNTGEQGAWIFQVGKTVNPAQACQNWYNRNKRDDLIQVYWRRLPPCPCAPFRLTWDRNWGRPINPSGRRCSRVRVRSNIRPLGKECCYTNGIIESRLQYAGSVLRYHPFYDWRQHQKEDVQARRDCCERSSLCRLFFELRPMGGCASFNRLDEVSRILTTVFGDPHLLTLDGRSYSFNGWGEYSLLEVREELQAPLLLLQLQGRTAPAQTESGTLTNATVFSAFAARDSLNASLQVELNSTMTGLIIYGNGIDHTAAFAAEDFEYQSESLSLWRENSSLVVFFSDPGLSLTITPGIRQLTLTVVASTSLKNKTRGLLGTFNDNPRDDFLTREGTTLPDNATEEQIFRLFGNSWRTTEAESVFQYPPGKGHADFQHPDFKPIFLDQADPALVNQSYQVCGGRENLACVYDFVATGSRRFAAASALFSQQSRAAQLELAKPFPELRAETSVVNATVGETATVQLRGSHPDQSRLTFHAVQPSPRVSVSSNGTVSYTPSSVQEETLSFYVRDSEGRPSQSVTVNVVLCSTCSGNGVCEFADVRQTDVNNVTNPNFRLAACICDVGWTGMDCETDLDACAGDPCSQGQNCTDLDPAAHQAQAGASPELPPSQLGFRCSGCPPGFRLVDNKCQDIDECNETRPCDHICNNAEGNYSCSCLEGYRMTASGCQDIDECQERTSGCQQVCTNTAGNVSCSCEEGYQLQEDGKSCNLTDASRCSALQCQYGCRPNSGGTLECFCAQGYELASDSTSCQNVDECGLTPSPCQQSCTDLTPGFRCSCRPGFSLAPDQVSCQPCPDNQYGEDCAHSCECGGRATACQPERGCVCQAGWTGHNCSTDVDECQDSPAARCGAEQQCLNTPGSFLCRCSQGYRQEQAGGPCVDVDECSSVSLNNCSLSQTCQNTVGSYLCQCHAGYHGDDCADVDECGTGQAGCQHLCDNVPGSFNCRCHRGYELEADRKTCRKVEEVCGPAGEQSCSQGCTLEEGSSTPTCLCLPGFSLAADGRTCRKLKEYTVVITLDIPFRGNTLENRIQFEVSLRRQFVSVFEQSAVVEVKVVEIRRGSSVAEASVLVAAESEDAGDSLMVKAVLALREGALSVGGDSGDVTGLSLDGKQITPSSSACEVLTDLYCEAGEERCESQGDGLAMCLVGLPTGVSNDDAMLLALAIGIPVAFLLLVLVVAVTIACRMKRSRKSKYVQG